MNHGISGETINKVYDDFRTLTVAQIENFRTLATVDWGRGDISDAEYYLMMHQASYALQRGWHK